MRRDNASMRDNVPYKDVSKEAYVVRFASNAFNLCGTLMAAAEYSDIIIISPESTPSEASFCP